jgi:phage anti-repressor protein
MQEIIKIEKRVIGAEEVNSVNAKELHVALKINKKFADWINYQIVRAGLTENVDFISFAQKGEREIGATVRKEYILTTDAAKHIAMMSQGDKAREVRDYFIAIEKKFQSGVVASNEMLLQFMQNQQQTNEVMLKLLSTLIEQKEQKVETITKEQMKKIRANSFMIASVIQECIPHKTESDVMRQLFTELNARMGVTSYYDIAREDFDEVMELQERTLKRWEDKRDNPRKETITLEVVMPQF